MSYIANISHGKDSLKMLDVIKSRGLPLDRIITVDVWATDTISADLPEVTEFKKMMDMYIKGKYGIQVEHLCARDANGDKITYEKVFYRMRNGIDNRKQIYGFPTLKGPWCNDRLKMNARKGAVKAGDIEYIGIAFDEPKRHKIISDARIAPLVDFEIDEDLCGLHCMYEGILSPTYCDSCRDGCWFCHNQSVGALRALRKKHPQLWQLLLKWDLDSPVTFKPERTVHDYDRRFEYEEKGFVPRGSKFKWSMLDDEDGQITMVFDDAPEEFHYG